MAGKFGLVGKNVQSSLSPIIHKQFFDYAYTLYSLEEDAFDELFEKKEFDGLNVTAPYKKKVLPFLDFISPEAERIGSVNTVVNRGGLLYGYNTDYYGFLKTVEKLGLSVKGKKAIILGSGGASLSVAQALNDSGAKETVVISRSGENNYENISRHFDAEIIVNTTPVGKYPDNFSSPLKLDGFENLQAVIDINYNPLRSSLLIQAKNRGIKYSGGLTMLVFQARKSAELFAGKEVTEEKAFSVERMLVNKLRNIVFIGMPSSGKSTVGAAVASKLGLKFFDTDEMIKEQYKRSPSEIITQDGEEAFRKLETEQIKKASLNFSCVISVGGGATEKKENIDCLSQNGLFVYLDRPICELDVTDRPLSHNLKALYEKRRPVYEKTADITLKVHGSAEMTSDEALGLLNDFNLSL